MTDESTPGRYRKRPVVVEGIRWTGDNLDQVQNFVMSRPGPGPPPWPLWPPWRRRRRRPALVEQADRHLTLWIEKSRAPGTVRLGDWVLAERDGVGFYPCTAEQFSETYEPAD